MAESEVDDIEGLDGFVNDIVSEHEMDLILDDGKRIGDELRNKTVSENNEEVRTQSNIMPKTNLNGREYIGFEYKNNIISHLTGLRANVKELGTNTTLIQIWLTKNDMLAESLTHTNQKLSKVKDIINVLINLN